MESPTGEESPVYSTCLFCVRSLGRNDVLSALPVGRMITFDAHAGRVWVICSRCGGWNLLGFGERWEVIEQCARAFSTATLRHVSGGIGVAKVGRSLELVQIGADVSESELAAWRYGKRLRRRRRSYLVSTALTLAAAGLSATLAWQAQHPQVTVWTGMFWLTAWAFRDAFKRDTVTRRLNRVLATVAGQAESALANWGTFGGAWLQPDAEPPGWSLVLAMVQLGERNPDTSFPSRTATLRGESAAHALAAILSAYNLAGASQRAIRGAVRMIGDEGCPAALLCRTEQIARSRGMGRRRVTSLPPDLRLAVEVAANSEVERHALNGDMSELAQRWRDADAAGAIADAV